jgi:hypothetical protein
MFCLKEKKQRKDKWNDLIIEAKDRLNSTRNNFVNIFISHTFFPYFRVPLSCLSSLFFTYNLHCYNCELYYIFILKTVRFEIELTV